MAFTLTDPAGARPLIALDGTESREGRALYLISALYFCLDWLPHVDLRLIDVANEDVELASDLLRWQHGVTIEISRPNAERPLADADLYAAAALTSAGHLRLHEANRLGIPAFVTMQFPSPEWLSASVLLRQPAAFDPRVFADELGAIVTPWL